MPRRSKVMALPAALRRDLEALMAARGFGDYRALADWLRRQGHDLSHAALHRHGRALERRIEQVRLATEQAEALVAAAPDDAGVVSDAALRQVQARIFEMMLAAEGGELRDLAATARALADTARASLAVRQDRRKILIEAAAAGEAEARKQGLSADTAAAIRAAIQGATA